MAEAEELEDVGTSMVELSLTLVLEDGKARNGEVGECLELVSLEVVPS